jgi:flagellar basal body P-ring formation protein FlgA
MTRFLLILVLLFGLFETSSALEISFNQSSQVDDAVIRLGDVAKFDEQTSLTEALATQPVGQAPSPGESLILYSQNVKQYLLTNRSLPGDITWSGSSTISIMREGIAVGPDRIQAIIAEYISNNKKNLPIAEIRFIPNSLPLPFTIPKGDLSYEVIPSNPGILSSSSFSIIFKVDGRVAKNMSVRGKIKALGKIVVAAEPLKKGLILKPQHLNLAIMDISEIINPAMNSQDLIGLQLSRAVGAGAPVLASMAETMPVIKRGQKVKIFAKSGALHLTATGFAHSDGKLDQMIKVQNLNSNKTVYGRVAAPGTVEVIL